ncbi:MAG: hypothetical protein IJU23_15020 [Proteobacteria bacterium]|nr:hypothetical protein [Pseudomonadota bacterium]
MSEIESNELKNEYSIQKNIIIHILNEAIADDNFELALQYIEKYKCVAIADSEFVRCVDLLKTHLQSQSDSKNSPMLDLLKDIGNDCNNMISGVCNECVDVLNKFLPAKSKTQKSASSTKAQQLKTASSGNPQESELYSKLREAYIKQKQDILDAIQKNIDDGDEQSALETIYKYQLVAGSDFNDLVVRYEKLCNCKLYTIYRNAFECLPEYDHSIRLRLANRMVMLVPDDVYFPPENCHTFPLYSVTPSSDHGFIQS